MPDIYVPGVKSRFDTEKIISGLMEVERIPRDRTVKDNEKLEFEKTSWQELGRRITEMRENARSLFSHQNPFSESTAVSSDPMVLGAASTRKAEDQTHTFIVKQIAKADRLLSNNLDKNFQIKAGNYVFSWGENDVPFNYSGGTVEDFAAAVNKYGQGKIRAETMSVKSGTVALVIQGLETGVENKLSFSGDAMTMAVDTGILGQGKPEPKDISIKAIDSQNANFASGAGPTALQTDVQGDALHVPAMAKASIALNNGISPTPTMILKIETLVTGGIGAESAVNTASAPASVNTPANTPAAETQAGNFEPNVMIASEDLIDGDTVEGKYSVQKQRVQGAVFGAIPQTGNDGLELGSVEDTTDTSASADAASKPENPPVTEQAPRVDNLSVLSLVFSDGTSAALPNVPDSNGFTASQFQLAQVSGGKTVTALRIDNTNTHREIAIRNIHIYDPLSASGTDPLHAVSKAQDAVIEMDGIEIQRSTNNIDDLIPGVNLALKAVSDMPVEVSVHSDTEAVKDSVITLVGNYNRLMADLNVLTRNDESIIRELTYLSKDEAEDLRQRLGMFSGDSALSRFRSNLQQIVTGSYATADGNSYMLSAFGISTDARRGGSYDPSKMRGYLEINEKVLDESMQTKLTQLQQVFGRDTDGDLIIDSGLAYDLERTVRPFVELGGVINNKTSLLDSRIAANKKRIETMDRQLANKEQSLKTQYGQMEGAYNRMEKLSNSLEQFGQQNK